MITFRNISENDLEMIGRWREKPRIDSVMTTHYTYDPIKQKAWYDKIFNSGLECFNWIILDSDIPVGFINLQNFNRNERYTEWGWYIGADNFFFGSIIPCYLYNMLFLKSNWIDTICAVVRSHNKSVIKLNLSYGYRIVKIGNDDGMVYMELDRDTWASNKRWHKLNMIITGDQP
jgi:hypothetical protein